METNIKKLKAFENTYWTTKSGERIKIKDLSLNHIKNIINMLEVRLNTISNPFDDYPSFQGEMAQYQATIDHGLACEAYVKLENTLKLFNAYHTIKSL